MSEGKRMTSKGQPSEFHRADPQYRRQMQWLLLGLVLGGIAAIASLNFWLGKLAASGDFIAYGAWLNRLLAGLCLLLGAAIAGFASWLYRAAVWSQRERRWPPAGMRTSADVRIRYLTSADALVSQFKASAAALGVLAAGMFAWAIWLFATS